MLSICSDVRGVHVRPLTFFFWRQALCIGVRTSYGFWRTPFVVSVEGSGVAFRSTARHSAERESVGL